MLLILDLDGTLANIGHRLYLLDKPDPTQEDWDLFFDPDLVATDDPIPEMQDKLFDIKDEFTSIVFLTGRPEYLRKVTVEWLEEYFGFSPTEDELFMRPEISRIKSSKLKKILLETEIFDLYGKDETYIFVDDEAANIEMFEDYGLSLSPEDFLEFWVAVPY